MSKNKFWKTAAILILGEQIPDRCDEGYIATEPRKLHKRIVGKAEYAGILCRKALYWLGGIGAALITVVCGVAAILGYKYVMVDQRLSGLWIGAVFLCGSAGCFLYILTVNWLQQASKDIDAILLTDQSVSSFPVSSSLVRASQESAQVQEAVLLRASTAGQEKHEEQLLRAVAGEQEQT